MSQQDEQITGLLKAGFHGFKQLVVYHDNNNELKQEIVIAWCEKTRIIATRESSKLISFYQVINIINTAVPE